MSIKDFNIKPDVTAEKLGMALKSLVQEKTCEQNINSLGNEINN